MLDIPTNKIATLNNIYNYLVKISNKINFFIKNFIKFFYNL